MAALLGGFEFGFLYEDGSAGQKGIAAAVVEMQVAVDDEGDVVEGGSGRGQGLLQGAATRPVVGFGFEVGGADAGVEEEQSFVVSYEVGEDRFGPRLGGAGL